MAIYPCDATGHRYPGRQRTMYPAVSSGALSSRRKLRLCKEHFGGFLDQLGAHAIDAVEDSAPGAVLLCYLCDQPCAGSSSALYVTVYDDDVKRADWWAPLHDNCVAGTIADWRIDTDMA